MEHNGISVRPTKRLLVIGENLTYSCVSSSSKTTQHSVRRAHTLRDTATTTLWPEDYIKLIFPVKYHHLVSVLLSNSVLPTEECTSNWSKPNILHSVLNNIRVPNITGEPLVL